MIKKILFFVRKFLYAITFWLYKVIPLVKLKGIVLCYHSISDNNWGYSISLDTFKKQVDYLLKNYEPFSYKDLVDYYQRKKTTIKPFFLINFDDGYRNILSAVEYLKEKGVKPILFVLADPENANRSEVRNDIPLLTNEEILKLAGSGWEIGCHSKTHSYFGTLDNGDLTKEISESKTQIEKDLGIDIRCFSYPRGVYNKSILRIVKEAGYETAFSMDSKNINENNNLYTIPRTGVMGNHSFIEFMSSFTPYTILLRRILNKFISRLYE